MVKTSGHRASGPGLPLDHLAMVVTSNICRTAEAFKVKMERSVLRAHDLSFAAFSTLFIVWIWEPIETRDIAVSQGMTRENEKRRWQELCADALTSTGMGNIGKLLSAKEWQPPREMHGQNLRAYEVQYETKRILFCL